MEQANSSDKNTSTPGNPIQTVSSSETPGAPPPPVDEDEVEETRLSKTPENHAVDKEFLEREAENNRVSSLI